MLYIIIPLNLFMLTLNNRNRISFSVNPLHLVRFVYQTEFDRIDFCMKEIEMMTLFTLALMLM